MIQRLGFLSAALLVTLAQAQSPTFSGKWIGSFVGLQGAPLNLEVVLSDKEGTWRMSLPGDGRAGRNNPCLGKEFPVSIISQSDTELTLEFSGSKVIPGCPDLRPTMKVIDAKTLEGTLKDGRPIKLAR